MGLDDFTWPDESWEGWWQSSEVSEVFKEQVKKASAWIKRTRKDEQKAKKYDLLLANFLVKLILEKKYDVLLEPLFHSMDQWYSSNFLLGIMSLVYVDISNTIRSEIWVDLVVFDYVYEEQIKFDDSNLDKEIKNRINNWVEDIISVVTIDYSHMWTENLLSLLKTDEEIIKFIARVFAFFLQESNIIIEYKEAAKITSFILQEIYKKIESLEIEEV